MRSSSAPMFDGSPLLRSGHSPLPHNLGRGSASRSPLPGRSKIALPASSSPRSRVGILASLFAAASLLAALPPQAVAGVAAARPTVTAAGQDLSAPNGGDLSTSAPRVFFGLGLLPGRSVRDAPSSRGPFPLLGTDAPLGGRAADSGEGWGLLPQSPVGFPSPGGSLLSGFPGSVSLTSGPGYGLVLALEADPGTLVGFGIGGRVVRNAGPDQGFLHGIPGLADASLRSGPSPESATGFSGTGVYSAALRVSHQVRDPWSLEAGISWTQTRSAGQDPFDGPLAASVSGFPDAATDSLRLDLSTVYGVGNPWQVRVGVSLDQTGGLGSFPLAETSALAPDRAWVAMGADFQPLARLHFDFGYRRLFLDETGPTLGSTPDGLAPSLFPNQGEESIGMRLNWLF
ncbi:MAG: hypothetical protein HQL57_09375 [Magnetococcales bacterium]|nr:hypothetical protein [Magnetococcales bacterium]